MMFDRDIVVVLDSLRSRHNVGSVFRTADGASISRIFLCGYTPIPFDSLGRPVQEIAKTALGAHLTVGWEHKKSCVLLLRKLKKEGYCVVAVEQTKKSVSYHLALRKSSFFKKQKVAVVFGNEVVGLGKNVLAECNVFFDIPMLGKKESLNVSVAVGIILYALRLSPMGVPNKKSHV
jgi:tRNA G18 (ribose-2'-O)-methylase SpoU